MKPFRLQPLLFVFLVCVGVNTNCFSQNREHPEASSSASGERYLTKDDCKRIIGVLSEASVSHPLVRPFLYSGKSSAVARYNPLTWIAGSFMFMYQNALSPELGGSGCPYKPSCSDFSKQCIMKFGMLKGVALTADRLTRCTGMSIKELEYIKTEESTGRYENDPDEYKFKVK